MKIAATVEKLDGVEEGVRGLYVEKDGKFVLNPELQIGGFVQESSVVSLRNNRDDLLREKKDLEAELTTHKARFDGVDPDEFRRLKKVVKDGKVDVKDQVEEEVQSRTKALKADFERKESEYQGTISTLTGQVEKTLVTGAIRDAAIAAKVRPEAVKDVINQARGTWKIENGKAVPYGEDGKILYGASATEPMKPDEWLAHILPDNPHWLSPSSGGDTPPGGGGGGPVVGGKKRSEMADREASAFIAKHGLQRFLQLPR